MTLKVIVSGQPVDPGQQLLGDVVTIHGLQGDIEKTWTHQPSQCFWPRDCLAHDVPAARILAYGYNADAAFGGSTATVEDHAKDLLASLLDKRGNGIASRPLVFVAHSLGGIIVKQALLQAGTDPRYKELHASIKAIIFFGTPHHGSPKANYADVLASIASALTYQPKSKLISALKHNSDGLANLSSMVKHYLNELNIVTFYETLPTKPLNTLIVGKESAILNLANEDDLPVDANHHEICKFTGRDDNTYDKFQNRLRRILGAPDPADHTSLPGVGITSPDTLISDPAARAVSDQSANVKLEVISAGSDTPVLDIVLIHGLFGDTTDSWAAHVLSHQLTEKFKISRIFSHKSSRSSGREPHGDASRTQHQSHPAESVDRFCLWTTEFLAEDFENARILEAHFDSTPWEFFSDNAKGRSATELAVALVHELKQTRESCPSRPIAFICHSVGGLIVTMALHVARSRQADDLGLAMLYRSAFSVTLLGLPRRHRTHRALCRIVAKAAAEARKPLSDDGTDDHDATAIWKASAETWTSGAFHNHMDPLIDDFNVIFTYYEDEDVCEDGVGNIRSIPTKPVKKKLGVTKGRKPTTLEDLRVVRKSPNPHPRVVVYTVNESHHDLPRFRSRSDPRYLRVSHDLKLHLDKYVSVRNDIKRQCMESLDIPEMYRRSDQIDAATEGTLEWLFDDKQSPASSGPRRRSPGLSDWLQSKDGMFWISGKPGSGKSTAMKHILTQPDTTRFLRKADGKAKWHVFGFFFTDRGNNAQRSWSCMLHVMLLRLLEEFPQLLPLVAPLGVRRVSTPDDGLSESSIRALKIQWEIETLQEALLTCKRQTFVTIRCLFLLDALDEHEGRPHEMAKYLKQFASSGQDEGSSNSIKVCVASRPDDDIKDLLTGISGFQIHEHTSDDVKRYVSYRLRKNPVMYRKLHDSASETSEQARKIFDQIITRAKGVFLWVRLVIDEVLDKLNNGKPLLYIQKHLRDLPEDLNKFFIHMLQKVDPAYHRESYIILDSVLNARQPLTILQLAMILAANADNVDEELFSVDSIALNRRIRVYTGGLLELIAPYQEQEYDDSDGSEAEFMSVASSSIAGSDQTYTLERDLIDAAVSDGKSDESVGHWTIQPIHQSVKQFLRQKKLIWDLLMAQQPTQHQSDGQPVPETGHAYLLWACRWWLRKRTPAMEKELEEANITTLDRVKRDVLHHSPQVDLFLRDHQELHGRFVQLLTTLDKRITKKDVANRLWPMVITRSKTSCFQTNSKREKFDFMAFAVSHNMLVYTSEVLENTDAIVHLFRKSPAFPLLAWALVCPGHDRAISELKPDMVGYLLRLGTVASTQLSDEYNKQVDMLGFYMARCHRGHDFKLCGEPFQKTVKLLLEHGANANGTICSDELSEGIRSHKLFDFNRPVYNWAPVAHLAVMVRDLTDKSRFLLAEEFVRRGFDLNTLDAHGQTLLEQMYFSRLDISAQLYLWLLERGARIRLNLAVALYGPDGDKNHPLTFDDCRQPQFYDSRGRDFARYHNADWSSGGPIELFRRVTNAVIPVQASTVTRTWWSAGAGMAFDRRDDAVSFANRKAEDFRAGAQG